MKFWIVTPLPRALATRLVANGIATSKPQGLQAILVSSSWTRSMRSEGPQDLVRWEGHRSDPTRKLKNCAWKTLMRVSRDNTGSIMSDLNYHIFTIDTIRTIIAGGALNLGSWVIRWYNKDFLGATSSSRIATCWGTKEADRKAFFMHFIISVIFMYIKITSRELEQYNKTVFRLRPFLVSADTQYFGPNWAYK